jgi:radical SAM superfamily enzyme YgiQ (UPF0313 family)
LISPPPSSKIFALSIAYELDIVNFISTLLKWNIEPLAEKRGGPLIIAGGVLTLMNPEPLAPFVDLIMKGDGELLIPRFAQIYRANYLKGKEAILQASANEPGFWAPSISDLSHSLPLVAQRLRPLHSVILTSDASFGEMFLIEVGRGCPRKCKFCASAYMHNYEYQPILSIISAIEKHITPPATIGLIGSALSDYPELTELLQRLVKKGYRIGAPSLRPDTITKDIAMLLKQGGAKTLTIAPEAGSLRLRKLLGKGMSDNIIYKAVQSAVNAGISKIKLYFLIGLPSETEEDIIVIKEMVKTFGQIISMNNMEISINAFIPKKGTPFEKVGFAEEKYLKKVRDYLRKSLPQVKFSPRSLAMETIQAIISMGGEKVGLALLEAVKMKISLKEALKRQGIDWKEMISTPKRYLICKGNS